MNSNASEVDDEENPDRSKRGWIQPEDWIPPSEDDVVVSRRPGEFFTLKEIAQLTFSGALQIYVARVKGKEAAHVQGEKTENGEKITTPLVRPMDLALTEVSMLLTLAVNEFTLSRYMILAKQNLLGYGEWEEVKDIFKMSQEKMRDVAREINNAREDAADDAAKGNP
jgi:hypothetical protein